MRLYEYSETKLESQSKDLTRFTLSFFVYLLFFIIDAQLFERIKLNTKRVFFRKDKKNMRAFFLLILVELTYSQQHHIDLNVAQHDCLIYNDYYNEALFSTEENSIFYKIREVFTGPIPATGHTDDIKKYLWQLEPVQGLNRTFYIRNEHFNEHLQALKFTDSIFFSQRRNIVTKLKHSDEDSTFMWRFDEIPAKKSSTTRSRKSTPNTEATRLFYLWSYKYEEPLYAANFFFKKTSSKRKVFLWHGQPKNRKYFWQLKCRS